MGEATDTENFHMCVPQHVKCIPYIACTLFQTLPCSRDLVEELVLVCLLE